MKVKLQQKWYAFKMYFSKLKRRYWMKACAYTTCKNELFKDGYCKEHHYTEIIDECKTLSYGLKVYRLSCMNGYGSVDEQFHFVDYSKVSKQFKEHFEKWLFGQTMPMVKGYDAVYVGDWESYASQKNMGKKEPFVYD